MIENVKTQWQKNIGCVPQNVFVIDDSLKKNIAFGTSNESIDTNRVKKVIELAVDEARRLNQQFIGTEHLLIGIMREGEGVASGVLGAFASFLKPRNSENLSARSNSFIT